MRGLIDRLEEANIDYVKYWDPKDRRKAASLAKDVVNAISSLREFAYRNPGGSSSKEAEKTLPKGLYKEAGRIADVLEIVAGQLERS
jgi:hypothetical protein